MLHRAVLVLVAATVAFEPYVSALWPIPRQSSTGDSVLFIDKTVSVTYNGHAISWSLPPYPDRACSDDRGHGEHLAKVDDVVDQQISHAAGYVPPKWPKFDSTRIVQGAVSRTFDVIFQRSFVPWMLRERASDFEPTLRASDVRMKTLKITQTKQDDENTFKPKIGTVDESYNLKVTMAGEASIQAVSSIGVLRALETFSQLFFKHSSGAAWYSPYMPVAIDDKPKFPYRGLLLDLGRHWFDISDIERTIDALAMNKMNMLHLHITETQSWPLEIPSLPLLAEKGAYHKGLTYSPRDIAGIQEYGVSRGVQVVLEIDMPGHVGVGNAYPDVSVAYNAHPWQWYCAQPPCGSFRLNHTGTEKFIDVLFEDLIPRLSPYTSYFHTGGDEYKANNSLLDPGLKTNNASVLQPLLQRFIDHAHSKIRKLGLTPLVWEEMVLDWNVTLGEDAIVQTWLGKGAIQKLSEGGHKVIDSSNEFYYLDCGRGEWLDSPNGEILDNHYPFLDWCDPTKNWHLMYSHEPTDGVSAEAAKNVLGGEVCAWTETIDATSLDSVLWPRAGAAAEIWWSGKLDEATGKKRSQVDARPRLSEHRERMLARGVRGSPITQLWCEQVGVDNCTNSVIVK